MGQRARGVLTSVLSSPHSDPRLDPSLALGKVGRGDIKPAQPAACPARVLRRSGSGRACLAGPPPGLGGGHLREALSQPHTSATFPWLHCVLAPEGSVALSTAGTALALTLAITPPGPQRLPMDPAAAEPKFSHRRCPVLGRPQSRARGGEHGGKSPRRPRPS